MIVRYTYTTIIEELFAGYPYYLMPMHLSEPCVLPIPITIRFHDNYKSQTEGFVLYIISGSALHIIGLIHFKVVAAKIPLLPQNKAQDSAVNHLAAS